MNKKIIRCFSNLLLFLSIFLFSPFSLGQIDTDLNERVLSTIPPPTLQVSSWVLMDASSGLMLAGHLPDTLIEPASLTKLLTAYIVFKEIQNSTVRLNETVLISERAWRMEGSRMFLNAGEKVKVEDLLMGLIVQSGNDAAVALAEHVAGSEEGFADLMNQTASKLGMENSNFVNSAGMPHPDHYTTARDLSILTQNIIKNQPEHYSMYSIREFTWNNISQKNRNPLLGRDTSIDGVKTGHTRSAGYCLIGSASRDGLRLIGSVMGAGSNRERGNAVYSLLRFGFAAYERHDLYQSGKRIMDAIVYKSKNSTVPLGVEKDINILLPKGAGKNLTAVVKIDEPLVAPIEKSKKLGNLTVKLNGSPLETKPLVALESVESSSWAGRLVDSVKLWFY